MNKPYNQVGPQGIEANIEYYLAREQQFNVQALAARAEREQWQQALKNLDRNKQREE